MLKDLEYMEAQADEVSGSAIVAFAKANKAELRSIGIEPGAQPTRKALMPAMIEKLCTDTSGTVWKKAPPKLLAPPEAAAAGEKAADETARPPSPSPAARHDDDDKGTPPKPPEKRTRRGKGNA